MSKKVKFVPTGRILEQSDPNFDWSLYENGYEGGSRLYENKKVKLQDKKDKVFCHEPYAQELYDMYCAHFAGKTIDAKDALRGASYNVTGVSAVSDHEISIDTNSGMSTVIDLNKEHQYLSLIGCDSPRRFTSALKNSEKFKDELLKSGLVAKVMASGRISLWEGSRAKIESEFMEAIRKPEDHKYAYTAKVLEINNGGYIVDVLGIRCFLPGSLASNGVISNFEELVGKTLPVIPVNYVQNMFVVSYKKYLEYILPGMIEEQLCVGKLVHTKVTGLTKNGIFVSIKDKDGQWMFSGLCHRSCMSREFEKDFDRKNFVVGDQLRMYIHAINRTENGYRIVLGDSAPAIEDTEEE